MTLQQSILRPNSSGEKTIKSAHIAVVENNNNDMWYYGRQPVVYLGGEEIKLNILPLNKIEDIQKKLLQLLKANKG